VVFEIARRRQIWIFPTAQLPVLSKIEGLRASIRSPFLLLFSTVSAYNFSIPVRGQHRSEVLPKAGKNQNDKSKVKNVWAKMERVKKKQRKNLIP
jgi:hypothetical protein